MRIFDSPVAEHRKPHSWKDERVLVLSPTPTHPQDYGNRKRVFRICTRLSAAGAKITFVHYPAEAEWRDKYPWNAAQAMAHAWAQFFTIAPSRDLHPLARERHHSIDEWWDESIGIFLRWLFASQSFDSFIVNYIWLSKALEFAPASVTRILDTHDRLSGRRELLESNGIAPEFFYTTEGEEATALQRADIVWAIKEEERIAFSRVSRSPVLTMPHLDPLRPRAAASSGADDRLRVGIVGARNNINRANLARFLHVAIPKFRNAFAPLKLAIAGSVCDLLEDVTGPFVELRGRMADLGAFYDSVDCVAVPIAFSTGLKIKTGEALSAGMPVVALAHAFEGYEPADRMHSLSTFEDLAEALVELSFAPRERLEQLGHASRRSHARTAAQIEAALESTRNIVRDRQRTIVIAVDSRAFVAASIFHAILESVHEYLKHLGQITVLVVRGSASHVAGNEPLVDRMCRVVVAADLPDVGICAGALSEMNVVVDDVREFLRRKRPKVLLAEALHPAFGGPSCADAVLFARTEMLALSEGSSSFEMPRVAFRRAFLVSPRPARDVAAAAEQGKFSHLLAPCLYSTPESLRHKLNRDSKSRSVALLGSFDTPAMGIAADMAAAWQFETHMIHAASPGKTQPPGTAGICMEAADYVAKLLRGDMQAPRFAVDLSLGRTGLQLCREILERSGVPVAVGHANDLQPGFATPPTPYAASTEIGLWKIFRGFACESDTGRNEMFVRSRQEYQSDGGWARIWRFCTQFFDTQDAEFA
ncbi:MAG: glycosyltransferase [Rhizomicrobium sp.]